jgi:hypothetical protein
MNPKPTAAIRIGIRRAEKANSDVRVTVDEEVSNSNDIQGSEEDRNHKQDLNLYLFHQELAKQPGIRFSYIRQ